MHIQAIKRFRKIRPKDLEMKKIEENLMLSTWHLSDDVRPSIEISVTSVILTFFFFYQKLDFRKKDLSKLYHFPHLKRYFSKSLPRNQNVKCYMQMYHLTYGCHEESYDLIKRSATT